MQISKGILLIGLGSMVALFCLGQFGCDDSPTKPKPEDTTEYAVYFYDRESNAGSWYYEYFPASDRLDSFWLPCDGQIVISADGSTMYTPFSGTMYTAIVDIASRSITGYLPYASPLAPSRNGELLALHKADSGTAVIRTTDHAEVYHNDSVHGAFFADDDLTLYGFVQPTYIRAHSLSDSTGWLRNFWPNSILKVMPDPGETTLYLYMGCGSGRFAVYDIAGDSTTYDYRLRAGCGDMAIDRQRGRVFFSDPGNPLIPDSYGSPWIHIHDITTGASLDSISTAGILPEPYEEGIGANFMAITPDNRWLVAMGTGFWWVLTIDLQTLEIAKYRRLRAGIWIQSLACQSG